VFLEKKVDKLPPSIGQIYIIDIDSNNLFYKLIYTLSKKELKALREYLDSSLEKG